MNPTAKEIIERAKANRSIHPSEAPPLTTRGTPRQRAWSPGHRVFTDAELRDHATARMRKFIEKRRAKTRPL